MTINRAMTRTLLASASALTVVTGLFAAGMGPAMAETVTTTTTETTRPYVAPAPVPLAQTTTERTVDADANGVVRSKTTVTGTAIDPVDGSTTTTRKTTETTTVR